MERPTCSSSTAVAVHTQPTRLTAPAFFPRTLTWRPESRRSSYQGYRPPRAGHRVNAIFADYLIEPRSMKRRAPRGRIRLPHVSLLSLRWHLLRSTPYHGPGAPAPHNKQRENAHCKESPRQRWQPQTLNNHSAHKVGDHASSVCYLAFMKTSSYRSAYAADEVSNTDKSASTCHFVSATLRRVFFPAGSPEGRNVGQAKASSRVGGR